MNVMVSVLGLAFLILIHEAGHFFAALAVGMRPRGFSIGFGPAIAKLNRKGIDYAIRIVPLGGYVKIPGMTAPRPSDVDLYLARAVREAPELVGPSERLKRALDADDEEAARHELAALSELAAEQGVSSADRGLQEIGDALAPEAYWRRPVWRRITMFAAGPVTNLLFAMLLFAIVFMSAGGRVTTKVEAVFDGTPAQQMGLRSGDRITEINGERVAPPDITRLISGSDGKTLTVVVVRDGVPVTLGPTRAQQVDSGGQKIYRLGFQLAAEPLGAGASFKESVLLTGRLTGEIAKSLGNIVHKQGRDQIASPVGIVRESSNAAQRGWENYLAVLAFISLSLGLLNLLPLLPLDGGHIVFLTVEKIRGHAIKREVYERVSAVGIALVLLLFFVGLSNDLGGRGSG
jgi:regulator of sigma E protease